MGISAAGLRAGKATIELGLSDDKVPKALAQLERRMRSFGAAMANVGKAGLAMGAAILGPLTGAVATFTSAGDALDKMSLRTGFSVESLSALQFAAGQSGANLEAVEKASKGMAKSLLNAADGSSEAVSSLARLGLTVADLRGQSPEQQFLTLADRLSQITDPSEKAALAMRVFGKSGAELLPLLKDGAKGIGALMAEAKQLGIVMSSEDSAAAASLTDAFARLTAQFKTILVQIGASLAPALQDFADRLKVIAANAIEWVKHNGALIIGVAQLGLKLALGGAALVAINAIMVRSIATIKALSAAVTFLSANPLIAVATILGGVAASALALNGSLDGLFEWLTKVTSGSTSAAAAIDRMGDALEKAKDKTVSLSLEEQIAAKHKELVESAAMPKTFAKLKGELADLEKRRDYYANAAAEKASFPADAKTKANNLIGLLPGRLQSFFTGAKLPPEVEHAFEKLGKAMSDFSNAAAERELDVTPYIQKLQGMGGGLERARAVAAPVATFDTSLSRQIFGAADDGIQEQQLETQKKMLAQLKTRRGGLPVV